MLQEELGLTRTYAPDRSRRRRRMQISLVAMVLLPFAVVALDYLIWHYREARLIHTLSGELGANAQSLLGWPLGEELWFEFKERPFTDDEWERLLRVLRRLPRNTLVTVRFHDCELTSSQLAAIERGVPECTLHAHQTVR